MNLHWQQGGYTTIKNDDGQYNFMGTTIEEMKEHVAQLDRKKNLIKRQTSALMSYINGETESNPDAMRV